MLPCVAEFMQWAHHIPPQHHGSWEWRNSQLPLRWYCKKPFLSPAPSNLQIARPSKPWQMYGRIVWIVWWLFWFEMFFFEGWAYSIFDDALLGALGFVCAIPCLLLALAIRRPRVVLLERAVPIPGGHNYMSLQQTMVRFRHRFRQGLTDI